VTDEVSDITDEVSDIGALFLAPEFRQWSKVRVRAPPGYVALGKADGWVLKDKTLI
jgi:hypothetical protein